MVKTYLCECCSFETSKKSTYNDHLKSKKHLKKISGDDSASTNSSAVVSEITSLEDQSINNTSTASRIRELEHLLQLKDLELQRLKTEYELKIQHKDEIISILKQQQQPPTSSSNNIKFNIEEKLPFKKHKINLTPDNNCDIKPNNAKPNEVSKLSTKDFLNKQRKNAQSIEDFMESYICNNDHNKISILSYFQNQPIHTPKYIQSPDYPDDFTSYYVNQICNRINELPQNEKPIYCSDKRRHHFYIKTNSGSWVKDNAEVDKILKTMIDTYYKTLLTLFTNMLRIKPEKPFLTDETYQELLEQNHPEAIKYRREYSSYNAWFKQTYNLTLEKYENNTHFPKIMLRFFVDFDRVVDKLKIALSSITGDKSEKYVDLGELKSVEEEEEESDYDCENDSM